MNRLKSAAAGALVVGFVTLLAPMSLAAVLTSNRLIIPGQKIGRLSLARYGARLPLGKPFAVDAGMSQRYFLWVTRDVDGKIVHTLFVHATDAGVYDPPRAGIIVDTIRVTSPWFRTPSDIRVGSGFSAIKKAYPALRRLSRARPEKSGSVVATWTDSALGIGFEFSGPDQSEKSRCTAVEIFKPGHPIMVVIEADALLRESGHEVPH